MDDPDEPRVAKPEVDRKPTAYFEGTAAIVYLFSFGTERSPAHNVRVVRLVEGRMTCARTFSAGSFGDLHWTAREQFQGDQATVDDVDRCLIEAGWQLDFPYTDQSIDKGAP